MFPSGFRALVAGDGLFKERWKGKTIYQKPNDAPAGKTPERSDTHMALEEGDIGTMAVAASASGGGPRRGAEWRLGRTAQ